MGRLVLVVVMEGLLTNWPWVIFRMFCTVQSCWTMALDVAEDGDRAE